MIPNIDELKKAMEIILLKYPNLITDTNDNRGIIKEIRVLYSACQLLCDVSDKMEPKKEILDIHIEAPLKDCRYWQIILDGLVIALCPSKETALIYFELLHKANLARSEDILFFAKKMMGIEAIVNAWIVKLLDSKTEYVIDIDFKDLKLLANAIRQEMGGGE
jgi:hypothetical protein